MSYHMPCGLTSSVTGGTCLVSSMHEDSFGSHIIEFLHALESSDDGGTLKHPRVLISLQPPLTKSQVKAQKHQGNKEERLQQQPP